jgi:hypothetical protein
VPANAVRPTPAHKHKIVVRFLTSRLSQIVTEQGRIQDGLRGGGGGAKPLGERKHASTLTGGYG